MKKKILLTIVAILVIIQFIRPTRNEAEGAQPNSLAQHYTVPDNIKPILDKACNDCHSNKTVYPWYANIQPVGWWLQNHVNDGKRHLNFDEFSSYPPKRQQKKLDEVIEQIKKGEMPLDSYTWIHKNAILTDQEKQSLTNWADGLMNEIASKNNLPPIQEQEGPGERD